MYFSEKLYYKDHFMQNHLKNDPNHCTFYLLIPRVSDKVPLELPKNKASITLKLRATSFYYKTIHHKQRSLDC